MIVDIREARRALSATSPLKLSYQASIYPTDYFPWKEAEGDDEKSTVFTKSSKALGIYNAHDCVVTARVWQGIQAEPEWNTPRVQQLYEHQSGLAQVAAEMHSTGIRIDRGMRKWMAWALLEEYQEKERKFLKAVGIKGFECQPNHFRALIFQRHARKKYEHLARFNLEDPLDPSMYVDPREMETISVDEDALTLLLIDPSTPDELKALIQLYWDAQEVWKARSTFVVSKKISHAIGPDGRLRAGWNSCGTDTGRFSCKDPNVMNIEKQLRSMYCASKGGVLVGADRMQFELRIMYAVTGDEALGAGIRAGNVYVEEAKDYFDLPKHLKKADIKPDAYKSTKNIRLAKQYGAGKKKVFQMMLKQDRACTYQKSLLLGEAFERRNARTVAWWAEETERVLKCGYSETRVLQRRRVYPAEPERTDTANYPIQGSAADIKNLWMLDVHAALQKHSMKSKLIIDLHDALYTDGPKSEAATVQRIMEDTAATEYEIQGMKYVFPVECQRHFRWGDFT